MLIEAPILIEVVAIEKLQVFVQKRKIELKDEAGSQALEVCFGYPCKLEVESFELLRSGLRVFVL